MNDKLIKETQGKLGHQLYNENKLSEMIENEKKYREEIEEMKNEREYKMHEFQKILDVSHEFFIGFLFCLFLFDFFIQKKFRIFLNIFLNFSSRTSVNNTNHVLVSSSSSTRKAKHVVTPPFSNMRRKRPNGLWKEII